MRSELDESFRGAHSEVARIIAELQRQPTSRLAASAREELETLHDQTTQAQADGGLDPTPDAEISTIRPIDWPRARLGDCVLAPGGGIGTLLSLPDRKGRVRVQIAGAKLTISRDQLSLGDQSQNAARGQAGLGNAQGFSTRSISDSTGESAAPFDARIGGTLESDLRGLRVEEALDRLDLDLDLAAAAGRDEVRVIHGIGTGALRSAVREHLPHSPHIVEWIEATREEGGAGATRVILRKD